MEKYDVYVYNYRLFAHDLTLRAARAQVSFLKGHGFFGVGMRRKGQKVTNPKAPKRPDRS